VEVWGIMPSSDLIRKKKINLKVMKRVSLIKCRNRESLKGKFSMPKKRAVYLKVLINPLVNMEPMNSC